MYVHTPQTGTHEERAGRLVRTSHTTDVSRGQSNDQVPSAAYRDRKWETKYKMTKNLEKTDQKKNANKKNTCLQRARNFS